MISTITFAIILLPQRPATPVEATRGAAPRFAAPLLNGTLSDGHGISHETFDPFGDYDGRPCAFSSNVDQHINLSQRRSGRVAANIGPTRRPCAPPRTRA